VIIANPSRLMSRFQWTPRYDDIETIVRTALAWERTLHPRSRG
jgi:UDP-glucose 4-epimerase